MLGSLLSVHWTRAVSRITFFYPPEVTVLPASQQAGTDQACYVLWSHQEMVLQWYHLTGADYSKSPHKRIRALSHVSEISPITSLWRQELIFWPHFPGKQPEVLRGCIFLLKLHMESHSLGTKITDNHSFSFQFSSFKIFQFATNSTGLGITNPDLVRIGRELVMEPLIQHVTK